MSQDQTQYVPLIRILSALSNVNSFRKQNKTKKQCMLYTALGYQNNFVTAVMLLSAFGLWWSRVMSQKLVNIGSGDGLYDCKCLTAPWSVIKWKHFPRYWLFVGGIHRPPVDSPHRDQKCGALFFSLICAWTNGWGCIRYAGDLRHHSALCDVAVMTKPSHGPSMLSCGSFMGWRYQMGYLRYQF